MIKNKKIYFSYWQTYSLYPQVLFCNNIPYLITGLEMY